MSGYGGPDDEFVNMMSMIDNYVDLARSQLPTGESFNNCIECGEKIPMARQLALKGVKHCIPCQMERDKIKVNIKTVTYML